ncbi:unnamed protein product [Eretmochelys imbricata]
MSPPANTDLGYTPPDGGWGWAVVFGASISVGFAYSFPKAFTVYFKELRMVFNVSYSQIAWVTSIMCATTYGGGYNGTKVSKDSSVTMKSNPGRTLKVNSKTLCLMWRTTANECKEQSSGGKRKQTDHLYPQEHQAAAFCTRAQGSDPVSDSHVFSSQL